MTITIREATEKDISDGIHAIYCHYVRESVATFEITEPSVEELVSRYNDIVKKYKLPYYVAIETNQQKDNKETIVGYCYASLYRTREAYKYTIEDSIYLSPTHQGKGIGTLLLDRLIKRCTELGYRQMIGVIGGSDHYGSIKLHEKMGFTDKHIYKALGLKFGKWVDVVTLQFSLGDSSLTIPNSNPTSA